MSHEQSPTASSSPRPARPAAPQDRDGRDVRSDRGDLAAAGTVFAGTMLVFAGAMAVLEGIAGISKDTVYVAARGDYTYEFDVTAWGWTHLVLGVIAVLVGYGLLRGAGWARYAGIMIAGLSMIANFMFLPYQPVWSVVMIAVDVFIVWSLAGHPERHARTGGGAL